MSNERLNPDEMARRVADEMSLDHWRSKIKADSYVSKWGYIFEHVSPPREIQGITRRLINATGGAIASDWLHAMVVTAWTYGFAAALHGLAEEEFMLFEGQPPPINWDIEPNEGDDYVAG